MTRASPGHQLKPKLGPQPSRHPGARETRTNQNPLWRSIPIPTVPAPRGEGDRYHRPCTPVRGRPVPTIENPLSRSIPIPTAPAPRCEGDLYQQSKILSRGRSPFPPSLHLGARETRTNSLSNNSDAWANPRSRENPEIRSPLQSLSNNSVTWANPGRRFKPKPGPQPTQKPEPTCLPLLAKGPGL